MTKQRTFAGITCAVAGVLEQHKPLDPVTIKSRSIRPAFFSKEFSRKGSGSWLGGFMREVNHENC
jgi:hypothetical protein